MKVTIDIPDADIRGVLERATPAIQYWAKEIFCDEVALVNRNFGKGWNVEVRRAKAAERLEYPLDLERALRMMLVPGSYWGAQEMKDWGAAACDEFIQLAAFGEVRYVP